MNECVLKVISRQVTEADQIMMSQHGIIPELVKQIVRSFLDSFSAYSFVSSQSEIDIFKRCHLL